MQDYDQAITQFEQAESKGVDSFDTTMCIIECLRLKGDLEAAKERLKRISRVGEIRAEYHYQMGKLCDANGQHEEAMDEYEKAIKLDSHHAKALFSLAFSYDLYGDETKAIEYYKHCIKISPVHISALLNLAVLYEEAEYYDQAMYCVKQVLAAHPNHRRAQMFRKDIESSMIMYFDEDHEKKIDKRNQVLEIPISDFELSVRSRNCLKKMNIRTLGDLLRVSETELLAYKNFGETSLAEIKNILSLKSLRLGQLLEDRNNGLRSQTEEDDSQEEDGQALDVPVTELELSVRSRKCLQRLNLDSIRDLVKCTEAELLGCKNFGMTSLYEIKQALKDRNLSLRRLDD
jgi:DNA-directed RNA polymerase subunit alpha